MKRTQCVHKAVRELKLKIQEFQSSKEYAALTVGKALDVDVDKEFGMRLANRRAGSAGKRKQLSKEVLHIKNWNNRTNKQIGFKWENDGNKRCAVNMVKYNDNKYIKPFYRNKMVVMIW